MGNSATNEQSPQYQDVVPDDLKLPSAEEIGSMIHCSQYWDLLKVAPLLRVPYFFFFFFFQEKTLVIDRNVMLAWSYLLFDHENAIPFRLYRAIVDAVTALHNERPSASSSSLSSSSATLPSSTPTCPITGEV
jgi:hypothetical protein